MAVCKDKDCSSPTDHPGGYCKSCYIKNKETANGVSKKKYDSSAYKPSEGELFIEDFLNNYDIKFNRQVKLEDLKGDTKRFRVADFYIPKYNVYIEFLGQWNTSENKERYKLKKDLYFKNKIPCVYLYPENLGILPFVFDKRLQEVLGTFGLKKQLRKYRIFKIYQGDFIRILFIGFIIFILTLIDFKIHPENNKVILIGSIGLIAYQVFKFYLTCRKIFIHNNYPLNKLDA